LLEDVVASLRAIYKKLSMPTATEQVPVLMCPAQKGRLARKVKAANKLADRVERRNAQVVVRMAAAEAATLLRVATAQFDRVTSRWLGPVGGSHADSA
jgi:hypothetical protein